MNVRMGALVSALVTAVSVAGALEGQARLKRTDSLMPNRVFAEALKRVRSESSVAPRLPHTLPHVGKDDQVYAIPQAIDKSEYVILVAFDPSCEGQHVCEYGTFAGKTSPFERPEGNRVRVLLRGGIRATYFASQCGAYCGDAYILWAEHGSYYSIAIKAGSRRELMQVANSAIAVSSP